ALGRLAVDVTVFAGKDVVLTGPGRAGLDLSRSGLGYGTGSGRLHLGRGPRRRPPGRQIGLIARAVIEIGPVRRTGHRTDDGPAAGSPLRMPVDHVIMDIIDIDVVIAAGAPPAAATPVGGMATPPVRVGSAHRHAGDEAHQAGDEPGGRVVIGRLASPRATVRVVGGVVAVG